MIPQLNAYRGLVGIGVIILLIVGLYVYVATLKSQISDLNNTLLTTKVELAAEQRQSVLYKSVLEQQNREIEDLMIDGAEARTELEAWQERPPEVRYKTLYKTIYKTKEVKSNECKDIKELIDNVRAIDYDSL
jgi:hypothetical protein